MGCEPIELPGGGSGFVCTRGPRRRAGPSDFCRAKHEFLCDFDVGQGKTCDAKLCATHAAAVAKDRHLCPRHGRRPSGAEHQPEGPPLWPEQARAWAAVEAECPASATADEHRCGEAPLVHTRGLLCPVVRCGPGRRRADKPASFEPQDGLGQNERTTDAYRRAELAGRLDPFPQARGWVAPEMQVTARPGPRKTDAPAPGQAQLFGAADR